MNSSLLKIVLFTFASISFITPIAAQKESQGLNRNSSEPQKKQAPSTEKASDYSQEALVIESMKLTYRFEKDGTGARELRFRARVQSDAAIQQFGQLILPYSSANEKLEIGFIRVKKPDGSVITSTEGDVQDLSAPIARQAPVYTDLRQKHVTVRGLRPGDTLEYHIIWKVVTPLAANHFWLEHEFFEPGTLIVLDEQLEVNIPRDSKVKLKTGKDKNPTITDENDRKVYSWKYASLKRIEKDEEKETKKVDDDEPKFADVQMTTFQNWNEVGEWYQQLQSDRVNPDETIRAKAAELTRGRNTDQEKIQALYEFVAKNFRYVSLSLGQGRYQPHAASEVMANQYGDCKDKHTLLSSMLLAAGLRGYPALMNSRRKIDPEVPSPGQFDHVITAVPSGNETYWMDTTSEIAPFRLLAPPLRDSKALVVSTSSELKTTPPEPPFVSSEVVDITGEINELGKLNGHTRMVLRGDSEMQLRMMFRQTPKSEWKRLGYYLGAIIELRGAEVTEIKTSDPASLENPFEIDFDFADDTFLNWSSKKEKVSLPLPTVNLIKVNPDKQDGSKPFPVGPQINISYRLKLTIPAKYQTRIPLPLKVSRDYAEYNATYKLEGNTLTAERKFRLNRHELPAERTQDYLAFLAATNSDGAQSMSLETDVAGTPSIPTSVKVEDLLSAAKAAAEHQNYSAAEELLKRVLEKEPKHKDVRRQLAWALFAQQKYDESIATLNEQTKSNPFDNYSYSLLGRVYWAKEQYPEAETAFRKQLEITPLDGDAHANLGQLLVQWRKFKEAIPELEQAISLDPDEESLYVSVGHAYLSVGESAKGIQALEKAVKLSPGPAIWNDVAYNLALSKVQLDKAQQYAESAVTTIATELRNAELEELTRDDLRNVSALAAYWDTLGWVYYQKGELELAEKYIRASWSLTQHSEVGSHLAEILEKAGKKDEALKLYAVAMVSLRVVPEAAEGVTRLAGAASVEKLKMQATKDATSLRTVKFDSGRKLKASEAQFTVLLVPGPTRNARVAAIKFIKGDEKLIPVGEGLKTARFDLTFPDGTSTKVIRRGTLFCDAATGECSFIMIAPELVSDVN